MIEPGQNLINTPDPTGGVPKHTHNGLDTPQIDPRDLLPFPILTSAPTYYAPDGTIVLTSISGAYKIYVRIGGGWHYASLT